MVKSISSTILLVLPLSVYIQKDKEDVFGAELQSDFLPVQRGMGCFWRRKDGFYLSYDQVNKML